MYKASTQLEVSTPQELEIARSSMLALVPGLPAVAEASEKQGQE